MKLWKGLRSTTSSGATSVIDEGCELSGQLTFVGTLIVNGRFKGEIESADTLLIGESGDLESDVRVGVAIIGGRVRGTITAEQKVVLRPTARVVGEIKAPSLLLEEGMVFDGHCAMKEELRGTVEKFPLKQETHG
jgi:cytoskeletal protein CcmA (bactofilin family)